MMKFIGKALILILVIFLNSSFAVTKCCVFADNSLPTRLSKKSINLIDDRVIEFDNLYKKIQSTSLNLNNKLMKSIVLNRKIFQARKNSIIIDEEIKFNLNSILNIK